ncbi:hypothetical protein BU23DRAFT_202460 [Bimuria novae-zelandiae CBS 107.79]|uniref:4Fe-4S ferredoxin-type domain-containing protein n=1 Tax=Bimuria novae-zelandiae CBS 107.79 TaxID=1447943 RepID=A0A6A5V0F5_9PLEO|nr:hypothetical protein BU23DRAFT_202460 [Bimuria novae-zelandiae CBS 107.79]
MGPNHSADYYQRGLDDTISDALPALLYNPGPPHDDTGQWSEPVSTLRPPNQGFQGVLSIPSVEPVDSRSRESDHSRVLQDPFGTSLFSELVGDTETTGDEDCARKPRTGKGAWRERENWKCTCGMEFTRKFKSFKNHLARCMFASDQLLQEYTVTSILWPHLTQDLVKSTTSTLVPTRPCSCRLRTQLTQVLVESTTSSTPGPTCACECTIPPITGSFSSSYLSARSLPDLVKSTTSTTPGSTHTCPCHLQTHLTCVDTPAIPMFTGSLSSYHPLASSLPDPPSQSPWPEPLHVTPLVGSVSPCYLCSYRTDIFCDWHPVYNPICTACQLCMKSCRPSRSINRRPQYSRCRNCAAVGTADKAPCNGLMPFDMFPCSLCVDNGERCEPVKEAWRFYDLRSGSASGEGEQSSSQQPGGGLGGDKARECERWEQLRRFGNFNMQL